MCKHGLNAGLVEAMAEQLKPGMYGVGYVNHVNEGGFDVTYEEGAVRYLHPACMLCNIDVLRQWPMPTKHGAPNIEPMLAIHRAVEKHKGRPITLNATGVMGALCCELDLPVEACRGIAVMARAIGLVGHILEEIRSPMSIELWQKVEHDVSVPPEKRST